MARSSMESLSGVKLFFLVLFLACPAACLRGLRAATSCSPLKNHGSFSTVSVKIGTPAQTFDLVADTGSDNIIVQSCVCKEQGFCPPGFGKCFRGTNTSSTFALANSFPPDPKGPPAVLMSFGSGQIAAVEATDNVQIGAVTAQMKDSLLLMVKQALKISGTFEGILGLGRPHLPSASRAVQSNESAAPANATQVHSFLELAQVSRFSLCFNFNADGVLGLNTREASAPMGSVGQMHWGLDFRGISVGSASTPITFCKPESKKPDMQTACGLIPDSGTTLMMGPAEHVHSLYSDLCSRWERCRTAHASLVSELDELRHHGKLEVSRLALREVGSRVFLHDEAAAVADQGPMPTPEEAEVRREVLQKLHDILKGANQAHAGDGRAQMSDRESIPKHVDMSYTFQLLLHHCNAWRGNATGLTDEMPSLFFHVAGTGDQQNDTLEMQANSYVIEMPVKMAHVEMKKLMGIVPVEVVSMKKEMVCQPAFGVMEYPTKLNGPVWIMGTPLFYEYQVHYDRKPTPPTMNFVREPCGSCVGTSYVANDAGLVATGTEATRGSSLRKVANEPHVRKIDVTQPL